MRPIDTVCGLAAMRVTVVNLRPAKIVGRTPRSAAGPLAGLPVVDETDPVGEERVQGGKRKEQNSTKGGRRWRFISAGTCGGLALRSRASACRRALSRESNA